MEQTSIREIRETMESIRTSFIPRAEANSLNPRDTAFLSEIVGDLKKGIAEEAGRNENVKEIYGCLAQMQGLLDDPEPTSARQIAGLEAAISRDMDEMEKIVHIANALQLDAHGIQPLLEQIRQKQEEVMRSFQQAVDIDLKLYGKLSELTERGMEAFHFEVTREGKVTEAQQVSQKSAAPRREQKTEPSGNHRQEHREPDRREREYLNLLPMGTEQFKETTEFLKRNGGRYDPERKSWYMPAGKIPYRELAAHRVEPAGERTMPPSGKVRQGAEPPKSQRQEYRNADRGGREYLNLLPMGTEQFKETTEFLKRNGGRYDPERKSWYMPAGKIPYQELAAHRVEPAGGGEKKSVLSRLGENQEKAGREGHQEVKGRTAAER